MSLVGPRGEKICLQSGAIINLLSEVQNMNIYLSYIRKCLFTKMNCKWHNFDKILRDGRRGRVEIKYLFVWTNQLLVFFLRILYLLGLISYLFGQVRYLSAIFKSIIITIITSHMRIYKTYTWVVEKRQCIHIKNTHPPKKNQITRGFWFWFFPCIYLVFKHYMLIFLMSSVL